MTKKIILLTGNERKRRSFEKAIKGFDIEIEIDKPWIPEIQAENNEDVASYSARFGADLLNKPVVKMDSGFYIKAINDFPGPYVTYVDNQIGADRFLNLLQGETNRQARIQNSLAYCEPGKKPVVFSSGCKGYIVDKIELKEGSFIDRLFVPIHKSNPQKHPLGIIRETDYDAFLDIWGDAEIQFAHWLTKVEDLKAI